MPAMEQSKTSAVLIIDIVSFNTSRNSTNQSILGLEKNREEKAAPIDEFPAVISQLAESSPVFPLLEKEEPYYFRSWELTIRPRILQDISPDVRLAGVPAQTAILRLFISENGEIDRVAMEQSFLPDEMAQQLIDAFSKLKFHPGTLGNIPVKSQMKIEVRVDDERTALP